MNGRGMVLAAQLMSNFWEGQMQLASKHIHGDLARYNNVFVALGSQYVFHRDMEMLSCAFNNLPGANMLGAGLIALKHGRYYLYVWLNPAHFAPGQQLVKSAFQLPDIAAGLAGQRFGYCLVEAYSLASRFTL